VPHSLASILSLAVPFAFCASLAAQSVDYHVDVNSGSDATGNGSVGAPWKTITHALNSTSGFRRIRAAAGEYSSATGESFPLSLSPEAYIAGAGRGLTILRATPGQVLVMPGNAAGLPTYHPLLESLTFAGQGNSVLVTGPSNALGIVDVEFDGNATGIWVLEDGFDASIDVQRSQFHNCLVAVKVNGFGTPVAALRQCQLFSNSIACEVIASTGPASGTGYSLAYLESCQVVQNLLVSQLGHVSSQNMNLRLVNSLVAGNGSFSTLLAPVNVTGSKNLLEAYWCTIADNANFVTASPLADSAMNLWGSILWNSGTNLDPDLTIDGWRSNSDLAVPGALMTSFPPQFDPLAPGQYRLSASSPLLDLYPNYGHPQPTTDFEGDPRPLDFSGSGAKVDVGWDERTQLLLLASGPAKLGTTVHLTTHGPAGVPVCAFLGAATTQISLNPGSSLLIVPSVSLGCAVTPATVGLSVPASTALVGVRAWVQSGGLQGPTIVTSNRVELSIEL
jgi:Protein of unknown function (DUF1565)